jgi:hypothetical protein
VTLGGVVGGIFVCLFVVLLARQGVLVWAGSDRFRNYETGPPGFPVPPSLWKHYVRAMPVLGVSAALFGATAWVAAAANGAGTILFGALSAVSIFVVVPAIMLFNEPKALVPPALRTEHGWIETRRRKNGLS